MESMPLSRERPYNENSIARKNPSNKKDFLADLGLPELSEGNIMSIGASRGQRVLDR